jgi:hypothetical protein
LRLWIQLLLFLFGESIWNFLFLGLALSCSDDNSGLGFLLLNLLSKGSPLLHESAVRRWGEELLFVNVTFGLGDIELTLGDSGQGYEHFLMFLVHLDEGRFNLDQIS